MRGRNRRRRTCGTTDFDYPSMVRSRLGIFLEVVVELRELQVNDRLFWIRADESASEALDRVPQPGMIRPCPSGDIRMTQHGETT